MLEQHKQMRTGDTMPKMVLYSNGTVSDEFPLDKQKIDIGRDPGCEISLNDPSVSRRHANLTRIFSDYYVEDLDSTNGTILNQRNVKKHLLKHGDVLQVGNFELHFRDEEQETSDDLDKTMVIRPKSRPKPAGQPLPHSSQHRGALRYMSGPDNGTTKPLSRALVTLGQPGGDVAVIARRPQGFYLLHVGGKSFPKINGKDSDKGGVQLNEGDIIEVGNLKMTFTSDYEDAAK